MFIKNESVSFTVSNSAGTIIELRIVNMLELNVYGKQ